jgi:hypothetical protein
MDWCNLTWWWCVTYFGYAYELGTEDVADRQS